MLDFKTILIFDEATYAALDLSQAIEESEGCVAGPVATLVDTLTILDTTDVGGAIVGCQLADAAEVVMLLTQRDVPFVAQICAALPQSLDDLGEKVKSSTGGKGARGNRPLGPLLEG